MEGWKGMGKFVVCLGIIYTMCNIEYCLYALGTSMCPVSKVREHAE